jgi:hypothetical protein
MHIPSKINLFHEVTSFCDVLSDLDHKYEQIKHETPSLGYGLLP